ncbi:hypothetical protein D3C72_610300 [compost metagenome]
MVLQLRHTNIFSCLSTNQTLRNKNIFIFASFRFFRGKNPLDSALKLLHADNLDTLGKTFM